MDKIARMRKIIDMMVNVCIILIYVWLFWSLIIVFYHFTDSLEGFNAMEILWLFKYPINCCIVPVFVLLIVINHMKDRLLIEENKNKQ